MLYDYSGPSTPYQYRYSQNPSSVFDAYGRKKGGAAMADDFGTQAAHQIPVVGSFIGAADKVSQPIKATNTKAGDAISTLITPYHQAIADFSKIGDRNANSGEKATSFFKGLGDLVSPELSAILAVADGKKRRSQEAQYRYDKQFENQAGYGYGLDKNGINYGGNIRHIDGNAQDHSSPFLTGAINGLAGFGGNLLNQFLSRPHNQEFRLSTSTSSSSKYLHLTYAGATL